MSEGGQPSVAGPRATAPVRNSHNFYGGLTLVVAALIALGISLMVRNTAMFGPVMMPRLFSILVLLAGLALVTGRLTVRAPQDFFGGAALVGLAVVAMLASNELPGQRGLCVRSRHGAATFRYAACDSRLRDLAGRHFHTGTAP